MLKSKSNLGLRATVLVLFPLLVLAIFTLPGLSGGIANAKEINEFTTEFRLKDCVFKVTGENPHFILKPGYRLSFEGEEDGELIQVVITVLNETEDIFIPDIGLVKTRVVEEREWVNDLLVEVSRNFLAICKKTNDVFYFGEDVDIFKYDDYGNLINITHGGAWIAGEDGAMPGLIMPGTFLLGSRYSQEIAPDVAMDRGENVEMGLMVTTDAGTFEDCVRVLETTPLEPKELSEKIYCPGVGLVIDDVNELVDYGF